MLLLATGGCSGGTGVEGQGGGSAASCAVEVTIAGTDYIAGRGGEDASPVPHTGTVLHGTSLPCADGDVPNRPMVAHTIPGVSVTDAVAGGLDGSEVMLAERLWQQPWTALPRALQPYVRR